MNKTRSWVRHKANASNPRLPTSAVGAPAPSQPPALARPPAQVTSTTASSDGDAFKSTAHDGPRPIDFAVWPHVSNNRVPNSTVDASPPPAPPPRVENGPGAESTAIEEEKPKQKLHIAIRFYQTSKMILFSSWLNWLLVFVPVGIALGNSGINPTVVFAVNAVAIIPLAGLLSFATESIARRLGDTVGALMNVTFGNAVELIIFILALVKDEIRIVQASLLGSMLSNLLLILGMCFLLGGLRYREQIYNSVVTQMSACLLSLSVMSLLLPTAFHASFTDNNVADRAVLQVSRGTSVILLLVYGLYLFFQLKSHAYMYKSTPQHVIDEESHPGVLADIMGSSSSSDSSSSSSSSDTDDSSKSNSTARRIKKVIRKGRRRRKSTASSNHTATPPVVIRKDSAGSMFGSANSRTDETAVESAIELPSRQTSSQTGVASGDEADTDGERARTKRYRVNFGDHEKTGCQSRRSKRAADRERRHKKKTDRDAEKQTEKLREKPEQIEKDAAAEPLPPFEMLPALDHGPIQSSPKKPFNIRNLSIRPALEKTFSTNLLAPINGIQPGAIPANNASAPFGLRRTASLPDRLNREDSTPLAASARPLPHLMPTTNDTKHEDVQSEHISKTASVILLLVSTALVALCAEYLVASINYLVNNTKVSEAFVGLIILPIIGNAAEHFVAVKVASQNKMDLAIGVAVGSSIQIALFVTPIVVLLGWILKKDMSLYFSLFETISLFVAAFIVNFLVLDGRSNYLEGALLCAAYVIIAVAAFFYPDSSEQSSIGGAAGVADVAVGAVRRFL